MVGAIDGNDHGNERRSILARIKEHGRRQSTGISQLKNGISILSILLMVILVTEEALADDGTEYHRLERIDQRSEA